MSRVICTTQDSVEWFNARIGRVTASRMADAMHRLSRKSKNGVAGDWGAAHIKYVSELAWGLITRVPADHYVSKEMDLGKQYEKIARAEYSFRFGADVELSGFCLHPTLDFLGASPDGLVGTVGGVEIKVPKFETHTRYLEADEIPEEYLPQMYTNMLCWEREWWDFVSFFPNSEDFGPQAQTLPDAFRVFRKRLPADKEKFAEIEECATKTMEEAIERVKFLKERYHAEQPF